MGGTAPRSEGTGTSGPKRSLQGAARNPSRGNSIVENKSETSLDIGAADMEFVREFLKGKTQPLDFEDVVYQVALFKTRGRPQEPGQGL